MTTSTLIYKQTNKRELMDLMSSLKSTIKQNVRLVKNRPLKVNNWIKWFALGAGLLWRLTGHWHGASQLTQSAPLVHRNKW